MHLLNYLVLNNRNFAHNWSLNSMKLLWYCLIVFFQSYVQFWSQSLPRWIPTDNTARKFPHAEQPSLNPRAFWVSWADGVLSKLQHCFILWNVYFNQNFGLLSFCSEWATCPHPRPQPFTSPCQAEMVSLYRGIAPHLLPMFIWSAHWTLLLPWL